MRAWISLALMFVAVAALGAWVYYRPQAPSTENHALSGLEPKDVTRIRLERAAPPPSESGAAHTQGAPAAAVVLERAAGTWRIMEPVLARADAFQVDRLLSVLQARSAARYRASDLARYGLEPPQATLTLNDQAFSYGAVNTMTREQYVLTRDVVYAIPLVQRNALPRDLDAMLAKTLFAADEIPVRFELAEFTVALQDGKWSLAPDVADVSPDDRNAWAEAWQRATAVQAARHGAGVPESTIGVGLKDGRTITLGVLQREPELVLLRADEGIQYHFFRDAAKRLLSPPSPRNEGVTK